jgi:hypothetical protein
VDDRGLLGDSSGGGGSAPAGLANAASVAITGGTIAGVTVSTSTLSSPTITGTVNGVTQAGQGLPVIVARGRATAQTAAVASVATVTVGAADASFEVSGNILITASTTHGIFLQVTYTDEGNTARTMNIPLGALGGTFSTNAANAAGAVPHAGAVVTIRAKAATAVTVLTSGTFTSVTYNVDAVIKQVATT